jgi:hypothetical protein
MLLPITFSLSPDSALIMLAGILLRRSVWWLYDCDSGQLAR